MSAINESKVNKVGKITNKTTGDYVDFTLDLAFTSLPLFN
jgi:hypothetical protein